jgi:hypothetical protein
MQTISKSKIFLISLELIIDAFKGMSNLDGIILSPFFFVAS